MSSDDHITSHNLSRRSLLQGFGFGAAALGAFGMSHALHADGLPRDANGNVIPGFGEDDQYTRTELQQNAGKWQPISDRKIKVGIAGYGLCKFGATFFYQNHPNVESSPRRTWTRRVAPSWPRRSARRRPTPLVKR